MPDPQVSMRHAEITYAGDSYYIADLGSQTGTLVNGSPIASTPVSLATGQQIVIGESVFLLRRRPGNRRRLLLLGAALGFVLLAFYPTVSVISRIVTIYTADLPHLDWTEAIFQGREPSRKLYLDTCFMRETGRDQKTVRLGHVTDYDMDGVSEVWLSWPGGERVYTFAADGEWLLLGDLPGGCEHKRGAPFPDLQCPGDVSYVFNPFADVQSPGPGAQTATCAKPYGNGRYQLDKQNGAVAWMPDRETQLGDPVPKPHRFTMIRPDRLAGFLAERGVEEAVHFVVCEDAVPGVAAQVLTASGTILPLNPGCLQGIKLEGAFRTRYFGRDTPVAVAFTATGRDALLDQFSILQSGSADSLFRTPYHEYVMSGLSADPTLMSAMLLSFMTDEERLFEPIAAEQSDLDVRDRLQSAERDAVLPKRAVVQRVIEEDALTWIPAFGCSELQLEFGGWSCGHLCATSSTFVTVREVGCEDMKDRVVLTSDYAGGIISGNHKYLDVRVDVKVSGSTKPIDVVGVKLGFREK
jgi:hypothetical protein